MVDMSTFHDECHLLTFSEAVEDRFQVVFVWAHPITQVRVVQSLQTVARGHLP